MSHLSFFFCTRVLKELAHGVINGCFLLYFLLSCLLRTGDEIRCHTWRVKLARAIGRMNCSPRGKSRTAVQFPLLFTNVLDKYKAA